MVWADKTQEIKTQKNNGTDVYRNRWRMGRAYDNRKARLIRYVPLLSDQVDAAARYGRFCECRGSVRVVRSCLALLTCSLPSTGRDLSQGILSDFAEKPQVLRLRLAPRTRQNPLRMTTLVGISTEPDSFQLSRCWRLANFLVHESASHPSDCRTAAIPYL